MHPIDGRTARGAVLPDLGRCRATPPITTIEGLRGPGGALHPMQQAFIDHDAFQCGYCTLGQILSAIGCVGEGHTHNEAEI